MSRGVAEVTRITVVVVLARLLTPDDYGVAGMALVVASFAMMFTDPALGAALIQRPTIDERDRSTVFWIAAGIGAVLTILGIALSGPVADFFGEAQVEDLFAATSLCFFLTSLSVVHRALLSRRLAYRGLEIRDMVSIVTGGIVAIAVAFAGFGPWAVVANFVAYSLMSTVLVWVLLDWRPHVVFSAESARNLSGFSTRIFSANVLAWGNQNLDRALIGRFLGAAALGAYSLAYTAMLLPMTVFGRPLHQVLSPVYSRIQDDNERLERAWLRSKRLSVAAVSPALLGLIVVAPEFVDVLFGEQWDDAIVPLRLLCVAGLANSLASLHWSVLQARGEAGTLLRIGLISSAVTWVAFAGGLHWGIVGVALFYAGARWLLVIPTMLMMTRALSFDFWTALRAGSATFPLSLSAAAVAFGVREALLSFQTPMSVELVIVGVVMTGVYGSLVLLFAPALVEDIRGVLRTRRSPVTDRRTGGEGTEDGALSKLG